MKITSSTPATIFVDMQRYGSTGGPAIKLAPGRHVIMAEAAGYKSATKRIFVEAGKSESLNLELTPER
jgi:hypothetical protein